MTDRMNDDAFDRELRTFLEWQAQDVHGAPTASDVVSRIETRRPTSLFAWPLSPQLIWLLVVLLLTVSLIGAAWAAGLLMREDRRPISVIPTRATAVATSSPATPPTSPSPSPPTSPPTSSPSLSWSKLDMAPIGNVARVAWVDGRFALASTSLRAMLTSTDGTDWGVEAAGSQYSGYYEPFTKGSIASWQDEVVGWDGDLVIARPPDEPRTSAFDGEVGAVGVGAAGIVARTHSALNFDRYITSIIGAGWADHMTSFDFTAGILRITTDDGRSLQINWAKRGFKPGDVADRGFGWHSSDGQHWTAIPEFPDNVSDIIAVDDGFIARGESMWHSADRLSWRRIGDYSPGSLLPWMGGAVTVPDQSGGQFAVWTGEGSRQLSLPAAAAANPLAVGVGPLGLAMLGADGTFAYSVAGVDWSITPIPPQIAADAGNRATYAVAVGERSVVVLLTASASDAPRQALWLGTLER